jgi:alpha,alpha-trehalase
MRRGSGHTRTRARAVFDRAAGHANEIGLLAEKIDPHTGELLGNFPQAFSHIGLINAAWAIAQAETRAGPRADVESGRRAPFSP